MLFIQFRNIYAPQNIQISLLCLFVCMCIVWFRRKWRSCWVDMACSWSWTRMWKTTRTWPRSCPMCSSTATSSPSHVRCVFVLGGFFCTVEQPFAFFPWEINYGNKLWISFLLFYTAGHHGAQSARWHLQNPPGEQQWDLFVFFLLFLLFMTEFFLSPFLIVV